MAEPTFADMREYLTQLDDTEVTQARVNKVLARARAIADSHCRLRLGALWTGWANYPAAAIRTVYGQNSDNLWLPAHEIGSVTAVTLNGAAWIGWTEDPYSGQLLLPRPPAVVGNATQYGTWGDELYKVTAKWGFGPMPEDVTQVVLELAVNIWRGRDRGMWAETHGPAGGGLRFTGGLTKMQERILETAVAKWQPPAMSAEVRSQWGPQHWS